MQLKKAACAGPRHSCSCRLLARCPGGLDRCQRCLGRDSGMGDRRGYTAFSTGPWAAPASAQNVSLAVFMCLALEEERASEMRVEGRWSTAPLQHSPPLLSPHSPRSVGPHSQQMALCSLGSGGTGQAFETLRPPSRACVQNF